MKHLLFLIVSGLFNKDSFSFPFPSPINGLKKKLSTYPLKNRIRQSICPLRFDIWWERVYIKNEFMITRIKKPAICRTVKSEQNFMLQITVWCGTPWRYLGKEKNSCCSGLHSVAVITPLPKETWGRKSLFGCSSPRSYSTPGVRNWIWKRKQRPWRMLLTDLLALWLLCFLCSLAHLTRAGTTHSGLDPPIGTNNCI